MATEISKPELWKFCTACDPHQERPFSVERAYIKHLSSQRHLRKISQPLEAFKCPECGKHFSRQSEVQRHLTNRRCSGTPGSRLITGPTTTSSKKHALSVSPDGVPCKIHRTAACTMDAIVGAPPLFARRPTFGHNADHTVQTHSRTDTPIVVNGPLGRLAENALSPKRTATQVNNTASLTTLLLHYQRQNGMVPSLTLSPAILQESIMSDTQKSCVLTRVNRTEPLGFSAYEGHDAIHNKPTSPPENTKYHDTPSVSIESDKEVDQWLCEAMESASLKRDDLAHVQVQSVISTTPAVNSSSMGSLFLLRSPKVSTPRWSLPSVHFPPFLIRSFARSPDIPAPMLTKLVGDDHLMSETSPVSAVICPERSSTPVSIVRPTDVGRGPHLIRRASQSSDADGSVAASIQSTEQSPPTSSYSQTLVGSPQAPTSRCAREALNMSAEANNSGRSLLHCASTGDARGLFAILMRKSPVDINYWGYCSNSHDSVPGQRYPGTALMAAARAGHVNVMYALLKASALRPQHRPDLCESDHDGQTAMSLAAYSQSRKVWPSALRYEDYQLFRRFLRTLIAVLCCDCPEKSPVGRPILDPCRWCERLSEPTWPSVDDVEEINECVREGRAPMTDAKRALLMTEDLFDGLCSMPVAELPPQTLQGGALRLTPRYGIPGWAVRDFHSSGGGGRPRFLPPRTPPQYKPWWRVEKTTNKDLHVIDTPTHESHTW
jgi:hypothetical protein